MLCARSDLDDVIQEVFFPVYKSLKDFRAIESSRRGSTA